MTLKSTYKKSLYLFLFILFSRFLITISLLDERWINPDEGAHLMDGFLILKGYVPAIDFSSRLPVYSLILAGAIKVLGNDLFTLRLVPVLFDLANSILILKSGSLLFNRRTGILAAILYLLIPYNFILAMNIKTEPVAMFFVLGGIYLWLTGLKIRNRVWPFFLAGIFVALGCFVRQSALVLIAVLPTFTLLTSSIDVTIRIKRCLSILAGIILVVSVNIIFYCQYLPLNEVLFSSSLNPFAFILQHFRNFTEAVQGVSSIDSVNKTPIDQGFHSVFFSLKAAAIPIAFSIPAFFVLGKKVLTQRLAFMKGNLGFSLVFIILCLILYCSAYAYYLSTKSFHPYYSREMLPFLCILASYSILLLVRLAGAKHLVIPVGVYILGNVLVYTHKHFWEISETLVFLTISLSLLAFSILNYSRNNLPRPNGRVISLVLIYIFVATFIMHFFRLTGGKVTLLFLAFESLFLFLILYRKFSLQFLSTGLLAVLAFLGMQIHEKITHSLDMRLYGLYRPELLAEVTQLIIDNSSEDSTVLSGAVVWSFDAGREPFMLESHPTGKLYFMTEQRKERLLEGFVENPPAIIVEDGYTERVYFNMSPELTDLRNNNYKMLAEMPAGKKYTIRVLGLKNRDSR